MSFSKVKILAIVLLALTLFACSEKKKTEDEYLNAAKSLYDSAIVKNDKNLFNDALNAYKEYIRNYPNSEKSMMANFTVAKIYHENLNNPNEAVTAYKVVADKFPTTKEAKQALFLIAFIYDESLQDKEKAKAAYKDFIAKYPEDKDPNDKMTESAKKMLEVLETGKSIEDIIKNIESQDSKKTDKKDVKKNDKKDDKSMDSKNDNAPVKIEKVDEPGKKNN